MEQRTLGKTEFDVSVLGFGGAPIGLLEIEQNHVATVLNQLLDQGVNLIDTAAGYRGSEEAIGKAISGRRDEFILVSKCGKSGGPLEEWSAEAITASIDRSLQRLQTDRIDVMLLHSCDLETLQAGEALGALIAAREAGKVGFAGYSGDNEAAQHAASLSDIAVIETSINICDQANINAVLPTARTRNVGIIAKRPIANAAWKGRDRQPGFYADYAEPYSQRFQAMGISPQDLGFEGDPEEAWPEIAARFTLSQPGVHAAIIGTTNPKHVEANLRAVAEGPLPEEIRARLVVAFLDAQKAAGEPWPGLR